MSLFKQWVDAMILPSIKTFIPLFFQEKLIQQSRCVIRRQGHKSASSTDMHRHHVPGHQSVMGQ
jgi:hypothetical protein